MKKVLTIVSALVLSILVAFLGLTSAQAASSTETAAKEITVLDGGDMLSPSDEAALTEAITANYKKYDLVFVVETVPSLMGKSLESVSLARANELGVGSSEKNNGVFIFLSRDDRKIRFELGRGVTSSVSDAAMTHIIDSIVTPQFKAGNYRAGIESGMDSVGDLYIGAVDDPNGLPNPTFKGMLILFLVLGGILVIFYILHYFFSDAAAQRQRADREYWEHKESIARLDKISEFNKKFKYSDPAVVAEYKSLPNTEARLNYLSENYPDFAALLQKHFKEENPSTLIVDRSFYESTHGISLSFTAKSNNHPALRMYKLFGTGFEKMSIDEANNIIRDEKKKSEAARVKERAQKDEARKVWDSIPEPTKKALRKAKTQKDRISLLSGKDATAFSNHYALIASMYLSSSSSSGSVSSGGSSSSRSSSSSSSSSSGYSSGSFGGGSFDGGGGSGSW